MTDKKLCLAGGLVGLIGGIILIAAPFILVGLAFADSGGGFLGWVLFALKLAILILGILLIIQSRSSDVLPKGPGIILTVAGGISLIPLLGWIGGIVAIVGGGILLANLKNV